MARKLSTNPTESDFGVYTKGEDQIASTYESPEEAEEAVLKRILSR